MPQCSAFGCNNVTGKSSNAKAKITFHVFPLRKPSLLRSWLHNVNRKNFRPTPNSRICSEHFTVDSFVPDKYAEHLASLAQAAGRTYNKPLFKLREDAVPSIFDHRQPTIVKERQSSVRRALLQEKMDDASTPTDVHVSKVLVLLAVAREPDKIAQGQNRPDIIAQTKWAILSH